MANGFTPRYIFPIRKSVRVIREVPLLNLYTVWKYTYWVYRDKAFGLVQRFKEIQSASVPY